MTPPDPPCPGAPPCGVVKPPAPLAPPTAPVPGPPSWLQHPPPLPRASVPISEPGRPTVSPHAAIAAAAAVSALAIDHPLSVIAHTPFLQGTSRGLPIKRLPRDFGTFRQPNLPVAGGRGRQAQADTDGRNPVYDVTMILARSGSGWVRLAFVLAGATLSCGGSAENGTGILGAGGSATNDAAPGVGGAAGSGGGGQPMGGVGGVAGSLPPVMCGGCVRHADQARTPRAEALRCQLAVCRGRVLRALQRRLVPGARVLRVKDELPVVWGTGSMVRLQWADVPQPRDSVRGRRELDRRGSLR